MKKLLGILTLGLLWCHISLATDISDFQIEGMSIGDSALKHFSEKEIKLNSHDYFLNKTYTPVQNDNLPFFETYNAVDFSYKTGDKKYIIWGLSGIIFYQNEFAKCNEEQDEIFNTLYELFKDEGEFSEKKQRKHSSDPTGKSINSQIGIRLWSGDIISVHCNDYSDDQGSQDHLAVNLRTKEFNKFLNIAYEEP